MLGIQSPLTISPAGSIKPDSPAGRYLQGRGVERKDFNPMVRGVVTMK